MPSDSIGSAPPAEHSRPRYSRATRRHSRRRAPGGDSHSQRCDRRDRGFRRRSARRPYPRSRRAPWSCPAWSTRTCTSTSPAAPNGKGFTSATRAAAAGGVTTIIEMPLNSIPSSNNCRRVSRKSCRRRGKTQRGCRLLGRRGSRQCRSARAACGKRAFSDSNVFSFPAAPTNFRVSTPNDLRAALPHVGRIARAAARARGTPRPHRPRR